MSNGLRSDTNTARESQTGSARGTTTVLIADATVNRTTAEPERKANTRATASTGRAAYRPAFRSLPPQAERRAGVGRVRLDAADLGADGGGERALPEPAGERSYEPWRPLDADIAGRDRPLPRVEPTKHVGQRRGRAGDDTSTSKPGCCRQTDTSPDRSSATCVDGLGSAWSNWMTTVLAGRAPTSIRRRIHHISVWTSTSVGRKSSNSQFTDHSPSAMSTGSSACPAGVRRYSLPRPDGDGQSSITPFRSRCFSRWTSSDREIPGIPRAMSLNRVLPRINSRRISGVQRSAMTSVPIDTGQ